MIDSTVLVFIAASAGSAVGTIAAMKVHLHYLRKDIERIEAKTELNASNINTILSKL